MSFPKFNVTGTRNRECLDLFRVAVENLNKMYEAGAIKWVNENRPDLIRLCAGAEDRVDRSILAGDINKTKEAITVYLDCYKNLITAFTERGLNAVHSPFR
ncbi:MAG: hypothetical protein P1S46_11825 [bacterium]|nr:hypothetical protein [bacterium]